MITQIVNINKSQPWNLSNGTICPGSFEQLLLLFSLICYWLLLLLNYLSFEKQVMGKSF